MWTIAQKAMISAGHAPTAAATAVRPPRPRPVHLPRWFWGDQRHQARSVTAFPEAWVQIENPIGPTADGAEDRRSEDLPYSHALICVPTIVQRQFELAQRHGNQPEL